MKKAITILVVISISLVMAGCGETERMKEFHKQIDRIEGKIDNVEKEISILKGKVKMWTLADEQVFEGVENLCTLLRAALIKDKMEKVK